MATARTTKAKTSAKAKKKSAPRAVITVKWGKQKLAVSAAFLASVEDMSLSRKYDTDKKKLQPTELTLPVVLYKELDRTGKLDINGRIASIKAQVGKTGALYVNGTRVANAYSWRLVNVEVSEVHNSMGVLDSARIECTFRAIGWPKGAYAKWRAAVKRAATRKTKKSTSKKSKKKPNATIANEVIAGKWGSGATRRKRLTAAGYNYDAIQKIVTAKQRKG